LSLEPGAVLAGYEIKARLSALASRKIDQLVRDLGHDEWNVREKALAELKSLAALTESALRRALSSSDLEIRARAKELLDGLLD
jgi:hypothetical protein